MAVHALNAKNGIMSMYNSLWKHYRFCGLQSYVCVLKQNKKLEKNIAIKFTTNALNSLIYIYIVDPH